MKWRHYKGKVSRGKAASEAQLSLAFFLMRNFKSPTKVGTLAPALKMANDKPRIAASSYLNTAPLVWSFIHGSQRNAVELFSDTAPARCAEMLERGEVDAALVPVIEYQRMDGISIVPDVCVGSKTAVRSVVLVTRKNNLKKVERVALDESSRPQPRW